MAMVRKLVISRGGQVSVPAAVRQRWGAVAVLAEDHGDHLILRPAPADPVAAAMGIFADGSQDMPSTDELRQRDRLEEAESDWRHDPA
jgi:hypothetical protein